mmetsp:Transcript_122481/g.357639  ORF Transcript_122481/g.357639 Transcript_122481/m.357639 type:complete len:259 (+) Transcript_122481:105-881(+)
MALATLSTELEKALGKLGSSVDHSPEQIGRKLRVHVPKLPITSLKPLNTVDRCCETQSSQVSACSEDGDLSAGAATTLTPPTSVGGSRWNSEMQQNPEDWDCSSAGWSRTPPPATFGAADDAEVLAPALLAPSLPRGSWLEDMQLRASEAPASAASLPPASASTLQAVCHSPRRRTLSGGSGSPASSSAGPRPSRGLLDSALRTCNSDRIAIVVEDHAPAEWLLQWGLGLPAERPEHRVRHYDAAELMCLRRIDEDVG